MHITSTFPPLSLHFLSTFLPLSLHFPSIFPPLSFHFPSIFPLCMHSVTVHLALSSIHSRSLVTSCMGMSARFRLLSSSSSRLRTNGEARYSMWSIESAYIIWPATSKYSLWQKNRKQLRVKSYLKSYRIEDDIAVDMLFLIFCTEFFC